MVFLDQLAVGSTHNCTSGVLHPHAQACKAGPCHLEGDSTAARLARLCLFAGLAGLFGSRFATRRSDPRMACRIYYCALGSLARLYSHFCRD
jgi:hypothetical protein